MERIPRPEKLKQYEILPVLWISPWVLSCVQLEGHARSRLAPALRLNPGLLWVLTAPRHILDRIITNIHTLPTSSLLFLTAPHLYCCQTFRETRGESFYRILQGTFQEACQIRCQPARPFSSFVQACGKFSDDGRVGPRYCKRNPLAPNQIPQALERENLRQ